MTRRRLACIVARGSLAAGLPVMLVAAVAALAQPARAAAILTISTCDESDLDAAITQANSDNAGDTITFTCSGTIGLTSTLNITGDMTLDGTGQQVTLDGQGQVGVLSVASGVTVTLNDLTITGGNTSSSGGGLNNDGGTVNITDSTFTGNAAAGVGGAILNQSGTVNITGSTIGQNRAIGGVGVANLVDATANITDSTFGGNVDDGTAPGSAVNNPAGSTASITGSLFIMNELVTGGFGAVANGGTLSITSSAFFENTGYGVALGGGPIATVTNSSFSGGVAGDIGTVTGGSRVNIAFSSFLSNRTLVGLSGNITGSVVQGTCEGAPADGSYNMESGTSCGFTGTGDLQNATGIGGAPNFELVEQQGSPGIDAVPVSLCPAADENGNPRPDDPAETACDMGATESDYPTVPVTVFSSDDLSNLGQPVTFTATFTPTDGGGSVAFYADGSTTPISGCGVQSLTQVTGTTYHATCTTSSLPLGTHAISATYSGDSTYPAITGSLPGGQRVQLFGSELLSSANPSVYGQPVTFTAAITPSDGSGLVSFYASPAGTGTPIPGCAGVPLTQLSGEVYTAACTLSSLPAGADRAISASFVPGGTPLTLAGGQTVDPAPLTADVVGSQSYGGSPAFTVTGYQGLVNGDTPAVVSGTLTGCTTTVGPGAGVGVHSGTISGCAGLSAGNYAISYADAGLAVSPAPLTAQVAGSQTYGGTPAFTVTGYSGLVNGDTGAVVTGTLTGCTTSVGPGASPGVYPGTISGCSGLSSPNYTLSYGDAGVTVTAAPLTITASDGTMTYGSTPPAITPAYSGFANGDGLGSLTTPPTCSTTATPARPPGSYPATCAGAADPNYVISYVPGTVTVNQAAQVISFTAPTTGVVGKTATLAATGGGSGNPVTFTTDPASGAGVCSVSGATVTYAAAGDCVIDASQAGNTNYAPAPQVAATITVDQAPAFVIDSPPLTAQAGQPYDYTFTASGTPAPAYTLTGAPGWLSVNSTTGQVTGTPPAGTTTFSYSVTATNTAGTATAGPFTVIITAATTKADISAALACPATLSVGGTGTCTLTAANVGPATATKVIAAAALPPALSELSCTSGCARHANVFTWALPSLAAGTTATFRITMQASRTGTALVLAAAASANPDPKPLNNLAAQQITIRH